MIEKALIVVITGVAIGIVNAVAGGGMLIGFPLLLFFGLSALVSNVTTNVIVLAGNITSDLGYKKQFKHIPLQYFWLLVPTIFGSVIGAYILRKTPNDRFLIVAPVLIMLAVVLFAFQPYIKQRIYRIPELVSRHDKPSIGIYVLVFFLSIYGGYFGAGYGLVMLAILSFSRLKNVYEMNAFKNLCGTIIAISALAVLFNSHLISWRYGLTMAIGTAIGGFIGAKIGQKLTLNIIRYIVIVIGIATAIYLYSQTHLS